MKVSGLCLSPRPDGEVSLSVKVESKSFGKRELWFSTPEQYSHFLCKDRLDAFLVGLIYPAMHCGEDLRLEGCVSKQLLFNMNHYTIPLLLSFSPSCHAIQVTADEVSSERLSSGGVGTGFSAGIDSFCTIYDWLEQENDPEYKINHLLFTNVGSHDTTIGTAKGLRTDAVMQEEQQKFHIRYKALKPFADEIGLDFIPLDSNLHFFHPEGHQKTHTLTSMSGTLALQSLFSRYYYASSGVNYSRLLNNYNASQKIDIGIYADPVLLPLLSTESTNLVSDGIQFSRSEKVQRVADYEPAQRYLNVCINTKSKWTNCSVCGKCCRTLMTLESLGKLEQFKKLFDIEKYRKTARRRFVCTQLVKRKTDPFAADNIAIAKKNGFRFPNLFWQYHRRLIETTINIVKANLPDSWYSSIRSKLKKR